MVYVYPLIGTYTETQLLEIYIQLGVLLESVTQKNVQKRCCTYLIYSFLSITKQVATFQNTPITKNTLKIIFQFKFYPVPSLYKSNRMSVSLVSKY